MPTYLGLMAEAALQVSRSRSFLCITALKDFYGAVSQDWRKYIYYIFPGFSIKINAVLNPGANFYCIAACQSLDVMAAFVSLSFFFLLFPSSYPASKSVVVHSTSSPAECISLHG